MDRTRNSVTIDNSIQEKIKHLSDEIKELAALIWSEKRQAEAIMHNAETSSEVYDEDDFTNLINGYQYTIDELKSVCKHLYEASVQYKFIEEDHNNIRTKYQNLHMSNN